MILYGAVSVKWVWAGYGSEKQQWGYFTFVVYVSVSDACLLHPTACSTCSLSLSCFPLPYNHCPLLALNFDACSNALCQYGTRLEMVLSNFENVEWWNGFLQAKRLSPSPTSPISPTKPVLDAVVVDTIDRTIEQTDSVDGFVEADEDDSSDEEADTTNRFKPDTDVVVTDGNALRRLSLKQVTSISLTNEGMNEGMSDL